MAADTPARRPRQQFTDEFKTQAVRFVLEEGQTVGAVARDVAHVQADVFLVGAR